MLTKLIDILALFIARLLFGLLAYLPHYLSFLIARAIIGALFFALPRLKTATDRNLQIVFPELSETERNRIAGDSRRFLAHNLVGFARIPHLSKKLVLANFDTSELDGVMQSISSRNLSTGALIITGHFGVFEYSFQALALLGYRFSVLARSFGLPALDRWARSRREMHGHQTFNRKGGYREIIRRLRQGENVVVMFDQNVKVNHAAFVPFFGHLAATSKAVALAVLRTNCPLVFAASIQETPNLCRLFAKEIDCPTMANTVYSGTDYAQNLTRNTDATPEVVSILAALHKQLEEVILKHPAQWFWIHRRYKTRPAGDTELPNPYG